MKARREIHGQHFSDETLPTIKTIMLCGLLDSRILEILFYNVVIYVTWMLSIDPVACKSYIESSVTKDIRGQFFFYWFPTYIHLLGIVVMFAIFKKWTIVVCLSAGNS